MNKKKMKKEKTEEIMVFIFSFFLFFYLESDLICGSYFLWDVLGWILILRPFKNGNEIYDRKLLGAPLQICLMTPYN
jgi:hypothetical protein